MAVKVKLPGGCWGKDAAQESRPWWEPPVVVYGLSQPRVRSQLERLVDSSVVRATDKTFMMRLARRLREDHEERLHRRIMDREVREVEREKRLILEGRMPIEETPQELSNHPVFRIAMLTRRILQARRRAVELKKRKQHLKRFDYSLLQEHEEEETSADSEMSSCVSEHSERELECDRVVREWDQHRANPEDYHMIKYEEAVVTKLKELQAVDQLYPLADLIVGPHTGKRRDRVI